MARDIGDRISEVRHSLSKCHQVLANIVLNEHAKVATMTSGRFADYASVAHSTVIRFVIALGYPTYSDFRHDLIEYSNAVLSSSQKVKLTRAKIRSKGSLESVFDQETSRINNTFKEVNQKHYYEACEALPQAKTFYIVANYEAISLAYILCDALSAIHDDVRCLEASTPGYVYERIFNINKGDVLFLLSYGEPISWFGKVLDYIDNSKAISIVLTNTPSTKIYNHASYVFGTDTETGFTFLSFTGAMTLINAFVTDLSLKLSKKLTDRLEQIESLVEDSEVPKNKGQL